MPVFKVGQRVEIQPLRDGHPLTRHVGKKGCICVIDGERCLVDDQVKEILKSGVSESGTPEVRLGHITMREWFHVSEIDHA
jgi:hypothetical protein